MNPTRGDTYVIYSTVVSPAIINQHLEMLVKHFSTHASHGRWTRGHTWKRYDKQCYTSPVKVFTGVKQHNQNTWKEQGVTLESGMINNVTPLLLKFSLASNNIIRILGRKLNWPPISWSSYGHIELELDGAFSNKTELWIGVFAAVGTCCEDL